MQTTDGFGINNKDWASRKSRKVKREILNKIYFVNMNEKSFYGTQKQFYSGTGVTNNN